MPTTRPIAPSIGWLSQFLPGALASSWMSDSQMIDPVLRAQLTKPARGAVGMKELLEYQEEARKDQLDNPWIGRLPPDPINPIGKQPGWAGPGPTPGAGTHQEAYGLPAPPAQQPTRPFQAPFNPQDQQAFFLNHLMASKKPPVGFETMTPPTDVEAGGTEPDVPRGGTQQQQPSGLSDARLWGLISAGLGILAKNYGKYGQAGPAIGEGGLIGVETYLGQRQQEIENQRRDQLAQQQGEYQRGQIDYLRQKRNMERDLYNQRQSIVVQLDKETDPLKIKALVRRLAVIEGDAANIYKADIEKRQRPVKGIEGAGGKKVKEVWRDAVTNEILWEGEPYERTGQNISMSLPPTERSFDVKYGGGQGETAVKLEEMAEKAHGTIDTTNKMMDYAQRWVKGGGQLGKAANIQAFTSALMQAGGLDPSALGLPKDAGPAQALQAIANTFVLSKIGGEGGMPANNFSNADREFLQATKPNIVQTPEGFILTVMLERGAARRAVVRDEMLQEELDSFPDDQSEKAYRSFRRKWRAYVKATPAWTQEEMLEMRRYKSILDGEAPAIQGEGGSPGKAWAEKNK